MNRSATLLSWILAVYAACTLLAMAPMNIAVVVFVAAWILVAGGPAPALRSIGAAMRTVPAWRTYFRLSLALTVLCVVSLVFAQVMPVSFLNHVPEVHLFGDAAKLWYLFLPLMIGSALAMLDERGRARVFNVWIGAFTVFSVVGIIQHYTGWPRPQEIPSSPGRYHATLGLGHHLSVASIFIFPFFAALDRLVLALRARRVREAQFFALASVLGAATLFLTYSRTLWVVLPIGVVAWMLWRLPRRWAIGALVGLAALGGAALCTQAVQQRLLTDIGIGPRKDLWLTNLHFFTLRPLTGVGFRHNEEMAGYYLMEKMHTNDVFSGHAHNNFLELLSGTGAPGAAVWIAWSVFVFMLFWRGRARAGAFAGGLFFAWIVFHLNGLTQVNFWEAKVQHQVALALGWALFWTLGEKRES